MSIIFLILGWIDGNGIYSVPSASLTLTLVSKDLLPQCPEMGFPVSAFAMYTAQSMCRTCHQTWVYAIRREGEKKLFPGALSQV